VARACAAPPRLMLPRSSDTFARRMPSPRLSYLAAGALLSYAAFAVTLGARIAGRPFAPYQVVVVLAAISLALTVVLAARIARSIRRGPAVARFHAARAVPCTGADADLVRGAASARDGGGGRGHVRPVLRLVPLVLLCALATVLVSGLLNVLFHAEGAWTHWADSARDLDVRATYDRLSLGALADPSDLRYGISVGEIRPGQPERLLAVGIVDPTGKRVGGGVLGRGEGITLGDLDLAVGEYGPGVRFTFIHEERGRLFEEPVPLLPSGPGEYARVIEGDGLDVSLRLTGWPAATGTDADPRVSIRAGETVLCEGRAQLGKVNLCGGGYAFIPWEIRPWAELRVAHRTFRSWTLGGLVAAAFALLAWPLLPARPFWYLEQPDGSVSVYPLSAWSALRRARR